MSETARKRLGFISFIQFVGVLSVIYGHSMNSIDVPQWLLETKYWVYTYHMPLFFFVSAYLFSYYGGFSHKGGYKGTFVSKFERLIVPYILWNILFIAPKYLLADYSVDHIELSVGYFVEVFLSPRKNILGHTWFLFALFEMYVLAIIFEKVKSIKRLWIPFTVLLTIIYCFGINELLFAIGDLLKNAVYFWVGLLLGTIQVDKLITWAKDKLVVFSLLFFAISGTIIWAFNHEGMISSMLINTCTLGFSVILLLGVLQINCNINNRFVDFVSVNSFAIYIMHWPVLMIIRAIVYHTLHWPPVACMIAMLVGGFAITTGIAYLLRRMDWPIMTGIRKYIFGM